MNGWSTSHEWDVRFIGGGWVMLDPDQLAEDERAREALTAMAALAGHFVDALHLAKVPEAVAAQMVIDWHYAVITDGVAWEADEPG